MIAVQHYSEVQVAGNDQPAMLVAIYGAEDVAAFKKLVQAGSGLEPNLSPAMKELADLVTTGKIQQPYRSMST